MKTRDELMSDALYLQNHGYFRHMPIMELIDMLEKNATRQNYGDTTATFTEPHTIEIATKDIISGEEK